MRPFTHLILLVYFFLTALSAPAQVWPGDINNNGEVNTVDILYWALSNHTDGPPRTDGSLIWIAQTIDNPWPQVFPDGQNFAFADCNGDGQIDLIDKIIISLNQDSFHLPYLGEDFSNGIRGKDPLIWLGEEKDENIQTTIGSTLRIPIHLGNSDNPVEDFFGISFRIMIDTGFIGRINPVIEKEEEDWLFRESAISILNLDKRLEEEGKLGLEVAFHLLDPTDQISGFGKIGDLRLIIEDDLTLIKTDTVLQVTVDPIRMINNQLSTLNVANDTINITIYQDSTSMLSTAEKEITEEPEYSLKLYPNPTTDLLTVELEEQRIASVAIYNILNQVCFRQTYQNGGDTQRVSVQHLPPGQYWIRVTASSGGNFHCGFIRIGTQ